MSMAFDACVHFKSVFEQYSDSVALIDVKDQKALKYGVLKERAISVGRELNDLGATPGDTMLILSENSIEMAQLFWGGWHAGLRIVPVNMQLPFRQIERIIHFVNPKIIACDEMGMSLLHLDDIDPSVKVVTLYDNDTFPMLDFSSFGKTVSSEGFLDELDPDDTFLVVYTSGSTGDPKGIELSMNALVSNQLKFSEVLGIDETHRMFNFFSMSYLAGVHNLLLLPMARGASVVIGQPLGGASLYAFWDNVRELGITTLWFTGAMLALLMAIRPDDDEAWIRQQIKLGLVGMAPLTQAARQDFESRFGIILYENYALSETAFISTQLPGLPLTPLSKGPILEGVEVVVVDENKKPILGGNGSFSQPGEFFVKTPHLFKNYIGATDNDESKIMDDGFYTGDIGYLQNGQLFVADRKKDLIIRGGVNIASGTVEGALTELDFVLEAAVVAVNHPVWGEEVGAAIVSSDSLFRPSIDDLIKLLDGRIADFQNPSKVIYLDRLPRGLTGKLDKKCIRQLFES